MNRAKKTGFWGREDLEILWGPCPDGGSRLWLGPSDRGTRPRRETHRDHLPGRASGLQWPQTLGRAASARGASPASARRSPCATRPDIPPLLGLHQADSPGGLGGAPRSGVWGGAIALAQSQGGGAPSSGLSTAQGGPGYAPKKTRTPSHQDASNDGVSMVQRR